MTDSILVTGGAGFIGSAFVLHWLQTQPGRVLIVDKLTYAGNRQNLQAADASRHELVQADMGDTVVVSALLARHRPAAVLNFAAESHVDRAIHGPADFIRTNVMSTFHLLEAVRHYWSALPAMARGSFRFLQVSTDEVFGSLPPEGAASTEGSVYQPNNPYSASKAAADHLVRAWHHTYGLPVLTTHCCNNYGPRHFPEKLIPLVILKALQGEPLPVYGDGRQIRDWLFVDDHCAAISRILAAGIPGETYNISSGQEQKNIDVVRAVCALLDELSPRADGKSYGAQIAFVPDRPGHDRRYALDAGRLRRELGWQPQEDFASGLRKTVQWFLEHPEWLAAARDRLTDGPEKLPGDPGKKCSGSRQ